MQSTGDRVSQALGFLVSETCHSDDLITSQLGITEWQLSAALAGLYMLVALPVLIAWRSSQKRFNRNGFTNQVWAAGFWILLVFSAFQIARVLLHPLIKGVLECPSDLILAVGGVVLALFSLYCFHLGQGRKGSFPKFLSLIAAPIIGEFSINSRAVAEGGVSLILRAFEWCAALFAHVPALLRI